MTLLYRGRQYVALTPQQKEMKKDWLLEQQIAKGKPSFDEVVAYMKSLKGDYANKVESEGENAQDLFVDNYYEEHGEHPSHDILIKHEDEITADAENMLLYDLRTEYDAESYRRVNGEKCYRAVALREGVDPTTLGGLGVFWSTNTEGADVYFPPQKGHYPLRATFEATVDVTYVDALQMIAHNFLFPEKEEEVTFYRHAPIFVHGVYVTNRYTPAPIGDKAAMTPIEDWRRA